MPYRRPELLEEAGVTSPVAAARAVRESVAAMRRALVGSADNGSPEIAGIENWLPGLERSVQLLWALSPDAVQGRAVQGPAVHDRETLREELTALGAELAGATHLAHTGLAFFQGLARLLGVASGGYTPAGEGAPLKASGTLFLRG